MPTLTIDNTVVPFEPGETLLQAAARANISIPTLCSFPGIEPPTSCYVCVVRIIGRRNMAPACATLAEEGLVVESSSDEVRQYRRRALELLMSEHAGDCEGPCRRICPADLDIPAMARHIAAGNLSAASRIVRERLALPGVLGYVCPAPCEKGCVRAHADGAVSIRELHKSVAEAEQLSGAVAAICAAPASGKSVAIIGAGPAGLSCAYYLSLQGHACTVIDEREEPGGMLRYGIDRAVLPLAVLDQEIAVIRSLGVTFRMGCVIGDPQSFESLVKGFDAVILATGQQASDRPWLIEVKTAAKGIAVDAHTFATSRGGVFACGGAIAVCRMVSRAVGQGRLAAESVQRFLKDDGHHARAPHPRPSTGDACLPRCDSHLGKLNDRELRQLVDSDLASTGLAFSETTPFAPSVVTAAGRCLQCDCGKKRSCALRAYAHEYEISRDQYRIGARKEVSRKRYANKLMHEPGKCIDCGRCIGLTASEQVRPGLAFNNRGFDVTVKAPFGADMEAAMGDSLDRCIDACPVGALWNWRDQDVNDVSSSC